MLSPVSPPGPSQSIDYWRWPFVLFWMINRIIIIVLKTRLYEIIERGGWSFDARRGGLHCSRVQSSPIKAGGFWLLNARSHIFLAHRPVACGFISHFHIWCDDIMSDGWIRFNRSIHNCSDTNGRRLRIWNYSELVVHGAALAHCCEHHLLHTRSSTVIAVYEYIGNSILRRHYWIHGVPEAKGREN